MPESCPVDIDFGRRVDRDAQLPAPPGQEKVQSRHRSVDAVPERHRPNTIKLTRKPDDRLGLPGAASRHRVAKSLGLIQEQVKHPPATLGKRR